QHGAVAPDRRILDTPDKALAVRQRRLGTIQAMAASLVLAAAVFWQGAVDNAPEQVAAGNSQPDSDLRLAASAHESGNVNRSLAAAEAEPGSTDWLREQLETHRAQGLGASANVATISPDTNIPAAADPA